MKDTNRNKRIKDHLSCAIIKMWASFTPTRFYEDDTNMDVEKEWISFSSNYISDKEAPSLLAENSSLILKVFKKSTERNFDGNALDAYILLFLPYPSRMMWIIDRSWQMCIRSLSDALGFKNRCLTLSTNGTISSNKK